MQEKTRKLVMEEISVGKLLVKVVCVFLLSFFFLFKYDCDFLCIFLYYDACRFTYKHIQIHTNILTRFRVQETMADTSKEKKRIEKNEKKLKEEKGKNL